MFEKRWSGNLGSEGPKQDQLRRELKPTWNLVTNAVVILHTQDKVFELKNERNLAFSTLKVRQWPLNYK